MSRENYNLCSHSFVKLHEAIEIFETVDCVREMSVRKSCMANGDRLNLCSS